MTRIFVFKLTHNCGKTNEKATVSLQYPFKILRSVCPLKPEIKNVVFKTMTEGSYFELDVSCTLETNPCQVL